MSIKSKVFAAAATLTLVGGVGTVPALSAGAATPSCGHHYIDIFSREFGTHHQPNYVLDVWRQGATVGQPLGATSGTLGSCSPQRRLSPRGRAASLSCLRPQ